MARNIEMLPLRLGDCFRVLRHAFVMSFCSSLYSLLPPPPHSRGSPKVFQNGFLTSAMGRCEAPPAPSSSFPSLGLRLLPGLGKSHRPLGSEVTVFA